MSLTLHITRLLHFVSKLIMVIWVLFREGNMKKRLHIASNYLISATLLVKDPLKNEQLIETSSLRDLRDD